MRQQLERPVLWHSPLGGQAAPSSLRELVIFNLGYRLESQIKIPASGYLPDSGLTGLGWDPGISISQSSPGDHKASQGPGSPPLL